MEPIPFGRDVLEQTDDELGKTLVAYWLSINAQKAGIEDQSALEDFAVMLVKRTADMDGDSVEFAVLESICRKACRGEYAVAGRMFREFVARNDGQFDLEELAKAGTKYILDRKKGGNKRAANDPRQEAKAKAFELWKERRAGKHPKLSTNVQFAIECMRRWEVLKSQSVICGWCTAWEKEARNPSLLAD